MVSRQTLGASRRAGRDRRLDAPGRRLERQASGFAPGKGRFGFSWRPAPWPRKASSGALGFPWISLDSLVRNEPFQWVPIDYRENFSLPPPRAERDRGGAVAFRARRESGTRPSGKPSAPSDFPQEIVDSPQSKSGGVRPRRMSEAPRPRGAHGSAPVMPDLGARLMNRRSADPRRRRWRSPRRGPSSAQARR
jgi:hypothetical protein